MFAANWETRFISKLEALVLAKGGALPPIPTPYNWHERTLQLLDALSTPASPPSWISPTLLNGWTNYGTGFAIAQYRKWSDGLVEVKGLIKNSVAPAAGSPILVLPSGYRPLEPKFFLANSNSSFASVALLSSGEFTFYSGSIVWLSLDYVFKVEQ